MASARGRKQDRAQPTPDTRAKQAGHPQLLRGGNPGRPKGTKEKRPRQTAKRKASLNAIYQEIFTTHPELLRNRILRAIKSNRPESFLHLKLAGEYLDGKPATVVNVKGSQPVLIVLAGDDESEESA
jgi:hypothetical protein